MTQVDTVGSHDYLVLVVDGSRPASRNSAPWTFEFDTTELSDGPHTLSLELCDNRQTLAASKPVTIFVQNHSTAKAKTTMVSAKDNTTPTKTIVVSARHTTTAAKTNAAASKTSTARPAVASLPPLPAVATRVSEEPVVAAQGPTPEPVLVVSQPRPVQPAPTVVAQHTLSIVMDGSPLTADVKPVIRNGQMETSFRALFTNSGTRIEWLADTRTARCVSDSLTVEVPIGSRLATVNGQQVDMGAVAHIENGRTVIPLKFFAQATGARIAWDASTGVASVRTSSHALASVPTSQPAAASMPVAVSEADGMRTPISDVAEAP